MQFFLVDGVITRDCDRVWRSYSTRRDGSVCCGLGLGGNGSGVQRPQQTKPVSQPSCNQPSGMPLVCHAVTFSLCSLSVLSRTSKLLVPLPPQIRYLLRPRSPHQLFQSRIIFAQVLYRKSHFFTRLNPYFSFILYQILVDFFSKINRMARWMLFFCLQIWQLSTFCLCVRQKILNYMNYFL